jgi:S-formylglutathione hydrolase FrmB
MLIPWCGPAPAATSISLLHLPINLQALNRKLHGHVVDYTHNHGANRRIWSPALGQCRDLYVYLPPGFSPDQSYPFLMWLHGFTQDETSFLEYVVRPLDNAIACGRLPPMIVAAPDGSLTGESSWMSPGSFFVNSRAGNFEDFIMHDVWDFVFQNYPVRPEREAHVLAGVSMGGGAAYNLGIKYRDRVKTVLGIFPPLNTRWLDCHCHYLRKFRPDCWGWRTDFSHDREVVGRFYGIITVRQKDFICPLYNHDPNTAFYVSQENPIELIDRLNLQPGDLNLFVAYGGHDQFRIDAQVESFLFVARQRGLCVTVDYAPLGKHNVRTALRFFPAAIRWLDVQLTNDGLRNAGVPANGEPAPVNGLPETGCLEKPGKASPAIQ